MKPIKAVLLLALPTLLSGCFFRRNRNISPANKYYKSKEISLKNADNGGSEVDSLFDYLVAFSNNDPEGIAKGKKKYGEKFFLVLVQEDCLSCEEIYGAFQALENKQGQGDFKDISNFKLHTIYVDSKNNDGDNLFEYVYGRKDVIDFFESTVLYMSGFYSDHPYKENCDNPNYVNDLENLVEREQLSTPTTFLIDLTNNSPDWTSQYGVREVLFNFEGVNGSDYLARARTLRDAWTDVPSEKNIFSTYYKRSY